MDRKERIEQEMDALRTELSELQEQDNQHFVGKYFRYDDAMSGAQSEIYTTMDLADSWGDSFGFKR